MDEELDLDHGSHSVRQHLDMMQGIITRMAGNSRSCKVWCVTLVAATLVLVARTGEPQHALIALIPSLLFLFLDSYYLALERSFISSQNAFVRKLHRGELMLTDIYDVSSKDMGWRLVGRCLIGSMSIWPFYALIVAAILVSWGWVL